jgi:PhzF family phenazine biosynthesis protein
VRRRFRQVDVFAGERYRGNPLAVVLDGDGIDEGAMRRIAQWTNLSETTFLLPPADPAADYRVRIFTSADGGTELPFARHPTIGSCHVWLEAGGRPAGATVLQECPAGLVEVRRDAPRLAFAAPTLVRSRVVEPELVLQIAAMLGIETSEIVDSRPR